MAEEKKVLVVTPREEVPAHEPILFDSLRELAAGRLALEECSWVDALLKDLSREYEAVVLDAGLLTDFELEIISKLKRELAVPLLLHSTEDRPHIMKAAAEAGSVRHLKKPYGVRRIIEVLLEILHPV